MVPDDRREDLASGSSYRKTIMELAEMMPQFESFSEILLGDESFCEMCKISCRGSAHDWFTKVITLSPAGSKKVNNNFEILL
jgi:hypothetical protein